MKSHVIKITHDGFPFESLPPQGTITLHYSDGSTDILKSQHPQNYFKLLALHGLKDTNSKIQ